MATFPSISEKLVRDKIPAIILKTGQTCNYRLADKEELPGLLEQKLFEELTEYQDNPCIEELADIAEVLEALAVARYSLEDLKRIKLQKYQKNGGFTQGIVLNISPESEAKHGS